MSGGDNVYKKNESNDTKIVYSIGILMWILEEKGKRTREVEY